MKKGRAWEKWDTAVQHIVHGVWSHFQWDRRNVAVNSSNVHFTKSYHSIYDWLCESNSFSKLKLGTNNIFSANLALILGLMEPIISAFFSWRWMPHGPTTSTNDTNRGFGAFYALYGDVSPKRSHFKSFHHCWAPCLFHKGGLFHISGFHLSEGNPMDLTPKSSQADGDVSQKRNVSLNRLFP